MTGPIGKARQPGDFFYSDSCTMGISHGRNGIFASNVATMGANEKGGVHGVLRAWASWRVDPVTVRVRWRRLIAAVLGVAVVASEVSCGLVRNPDRLDYLGPAVHRLPEKAVYAFLIARYGGGVAFPDRESKTTVSASGVTSTPIHTTGMAALTASARDVGQDALVWLDLGITAPSAKYQSTPIRIGPDGRVDSNHPVDGVRAASGSCDRRQFAVLQVGDGQNAGEETYQVVELAEDKVRRGPEWSAAGTQFDRGVPWTCMEGAARFYMSNSTPGLPNTGTEVREVDLSTLATRSLGFGDVGMTEASFEAATADWQSMVASDDGWWQDGDSRAFVTWEGNVMRLRVGGTELEKMYSLKKVIPGRFTIDAANASSNATAVLWAEGLADEGDVDRKEGHVVTIDLRARRLEPAVAPEPRWLGWRLRDQPLVVRDVAVIRP